MLKKIALILTFTAPLLGCTSIWEAKYGSEKPQISYIIPDKKAPDRIYVWNPNSTAAYVNPNNQFCISTADVYKTRNNEYEAALKAGAIEQISNLKTSTRLKLLDQATKLSEKDAAGTFLSIALFNICMISANKNLTDIQTTSLIERAIDRSADVANGKNE